MGHRVQGEDRGSCGGLLARLGDTQVGKRTSGSIPRAEGGQALVGGGGSLGVGTGVGDTIAVSDLVPRPARPGASQSAAPWLPALCPRAALGTHSRGGMGRAAAGNPGRCRQRGRSPGGRRRRDPRPRNSRKPRSPRRRRKARGCRRRRARPRRTIPAPGPFNPGPLLQEPAQDSSCAELLGSVCGQGYPYCPLPW